MKITDPKSITSSLDQPAAKAPKNGSQGPAPVEGPAVQLSGLANRLSLLQTELAATPAFDSARVDAIKQAIRDGELRINPEAIADKLLASVGELLRRPH
ncbi:MAG TPA: flagellar biosynthesis anti-sigma factor FlgM [Burkholderiales bacterium]|nr:flagellar biosynthesis anti-sigma factor FlgM [Burkholderiales bacterium]